MGITIHNFLITGLPGVGKTTLIKKIAERLESFHPVGFYTEEIREKGIRKGFELISFAGKRRILSHVNIRSVHRVGKYGVDVSGFEDFLITVNFLSPLPNPLIIDEIGKMECFSDTFNRLMRELLNSERLVIATIAAKGGGLIAEIKKRDDMRIFEITQSNRDLILEDILCKAKSVLAQIP